MSPIGDPPHGDPHWELSDLHGRLRLAPPWIETHGPFGGLRIYDKSPRWPWPVEHDGMAEEIAELKRRVARLETMQRRRPKRRRR